MGISCLLSALPQWKLAKTPNNKVYFTARGARSASCPTPTLRHFKISRVFWNNAAGDIFEVYIPKAVFNLEKNHLFWTIKSSIFFPDSIFFSQTNHRNFDRQKIIFFFYWKITCRVDFCIFGLRKWILIFSLKLDF